jgi:hypothetical protein
MRSAIKKTHWLALGALLCSSTVLSKSTQGVFPMERLYLVIDGANAPSHGSRDMPIWGQDFKAQDAAYDLEARGQYGPAALVRARILTLLEYINRLQVK